MKHAEQLEEVEGGFESTPPHDASRPPQTGQQTREAKWHSHIPVVYWKSDLESWPEYKWVSHSDES